MELTCLFAATLKYYRELSGMSQENLAAAAGLDRTYISQLERGVKSPTLNTLKKLATCLELEVVNLLREPSGVHAPRFPRDYTSCEKVEITILRGQNRISIPVYLVTSAINIAHGLIDDLYAVDIDIASILGLRNLSAFFGELFAVSLVKSGDGLFRSNPHQDGYPDLLLMDQYGNRQWDKLKNRINEKQPFSPFLASGLEIKATCGSVPTPSICRKKGIDRPSLGDTRINCMSGYDWKAHHRETNNLLGILWDFIDNRPRIAAVFYSSALDEGDWGKIVQPRRGGGRTTSVSIMSRHGIRKMYEGWLCVLSNGGYREFLNHRNKGDII